MSDNLDTPPLEESQTSHVVEEKPGLPDKVLGIKKDVPYTLPDSDTSNVPASISPTGPNKLDKTVLSNLNKSLKVKQKIINTKELQPKNSVLITDLINRSPQASTFPIDSAPSTTNLTSLNLSNDNNVAPNGITTNPTSGNITPDISENIPNLQLSESNQLNSINKKTKKQSKQSANPTRTDIFAAKLASAVDDVDSSDSDETFVYENNSNDFSQRDTAEPEPELESEHDPEQEIRNDVNENNEYDENNELKGSRSALHLGASPGGPRTATATGPGTKLAAQSDNEDVSSDSGAEEGSVSANDTDLTFNLNTKNDTHGNYDNGSILETDFDSPPQSKQQERDLINESSASVKLKSFMPKPQAISNGSVHSNEGAQKPRPSTQRTYSNHSLIYDDGKRPLSPYNNNNSSFTSSSNHAYSSYKNYLDKYSSYNDVEDGGMDSREEEDDDDEGKDETISRKFETEDEVDVDDLSSHDSFGSSKNLMTSSHTTAGALGPGPLESNSSQAPKLPKIDKRSEQTNSMTSKGTKKKSSVQSSKLRSTASKLFDKKGSQPRRYSIIPDDIDIEDFDDELIYYDNNVRFPYNSNTTSNPSNNPSMNFNDQSPLINNNQRIPHYRSLNLNPQQKRNRTKRYISTGGQPLPQNQSNQDMFPFPYPEQPNQSNYFFGFDEYDEETGSINDQQFDKMSRKQSSKFYHPSNNHFILPRKRSFSYVKRTIYTMISIISILTLGFLMGFFIATTKDLSNVAISEVQNPVVSQDELIFNIVVEAVNPGWFTIGIKDVELDIFARSGYLPGDDDDEVPGTMKEDYEETDVIEITNKGDSKSIALAKQSAVETVLLGSITSLESEMTFQGVVFNRDVIQQIGEIKLVQPGKNITSFYSNGTDPDNSAKWSVISKNPFDLIIKGVFKYSLPLSKDMKTVVVNKTSYIDPSVT